LGKADEDTLPTRRLRTSQRPGSLRRFSLAVLILYIALGMTACGGGEISLTEYTELINDAATEAGERATQLTEEGVLGGDVSPQEVEAGIGRGLAEIRIPLQEAVDAIVPPEQVAELHALLWSWHADFIAIETTLAGRIGETPDTEAGWTALSESTEMAAYRASIAEGKQVCLDFQAQLDETEARGAFEDVPWLPNELSEVVNAALGCEWFPDDPESVYLYPPP
jgi:hypothetical protein